MNTIARVVCSMSLLAGLAFAAPEAAAAPVYNWSGFYVTKDTGMAQYSAQLPAPSGAGGLAQLYIGSENFGTGPGKVNAVSTQGVTQTWTTPTEDSSVDFFGAILSFYTGNIAMMGTDSAHVYLFDGNGTWTNITPTAASFASNRGVYSGVQFGQKLFIGTGGNVGSAQIWSFDGTQWAQQSLPGFPGDNYYVWTMVVFNGSVYIGTVDYTQAAQVWRYDGTTWSMMTIPGFSNNNYAIASMAVFNGKLYIGTSNTLGAGAEIWSFDGSNWTKLTGFGRNDSATSMTAYNGALYIGTTNYAQGAVAQLWAYDGTTLSQVTVPGAFASGGNSGIVSLGVANGTLYAGTYNQTGAELWSITSSGSSGPAANLPGALSGLWWNPNESGWGIDFTQRGAAIFAAWFTYDASGKPMWYVASDCVGASGSSGTCNGTLYQVSGPAFFGTSFNPQQVNEAAAGNLSVSFQDTSNASMTYTVAGQTRTVAITRQPVGVGSTVAPVDYTDLWWNPNESGWGMAMAQQFGNIFLAWFVYQSNGQPMWYVASSCLISGSSCSGTLYATTGPPFGPAFDPTQVRISSVGSVTVNFVDANDAVLSYTVNGVPGTKNITRQLF